MFTARPSATATQEALVSPTTPPITETPGPPLTPSPTLSAEEKKEKLIDLLKFNGGCEFPCWWGIQPGTTSIEEARNLASVAGRRPAEYDGPGLHGYMLDLSLDQANVGDISVALYDDQDTIYRIGVILREPSRLPEYADAFQEFDLRSILRRYGKPSDVVLTVQLPAERNDVPGYQLWVVYKHLGFMVEYFGTTRPEDPLKICSPTTDDPKLIYVDLTMQDPGSKTDLLRTISSAHGFKPLEGNSNMDIDQFTTVFSSDEPNPCFTTPRDIWP